MKRMIALDGAQGEGGGQILRSALSLSMITGQPFTITGIRAGRAKPGLLRQHLTAVKAAAEICRATVEGAELGSQRLVFRPGTVRGGDYRFAIGSAGSCTLVLQTVLPALWFADGPSRVEVSGGTDNPSAPPADFYPPGAGAAAGENRSSSANHAVTSRFLSCRRRRGGNGSLTGGIV
ncbi:RNA 3'-terminal-phosphate cyclase [Escherichia coli]|uniref:RNA 3'-terminal-phosphate cyclase (ATP) n=1 Tax=Escherichia coli TaxID=562 RepID=A0A376VTQ4_ECOLX|nr:RNA 3'-terminal-phosphate cyclase [Escherichia coli]